LSLGEAVEEGGELATAETLLRAACVALQGEHDPDLPRLAWARARRAALAWRRADWTTAAELTARTLSARRAGRLADSPWTRLFGAFERASGVDPEARLSAALWQARAHAALARGDLAEARRAGERARAAVGGSRAAREAQVELERVLASAAGR
jgi:hypothetical protein